MADQLDKVWKDGRTEGRLRLQHIYKYEGIITLRAELRELVAALEKCENTLQTVPLILKRIEIIQALLKDKVFVLKEVKRALEYEKEFFKDEDNKEEANG